MTPAQKDTAAAATDAFFAERPDEPKRDPRGVWRQRIWKLREARGHQCERVSVETGKRCRAVNDLEFSHLKPTGLNGRGRGQTQRYLDIERNPDCYEPVCKKHHDRKRRS